MGWRLRGCLHLDFYLCRQIAAGEAAITMPFVLAAVLLFTASRDTLLSFALGIVAGLAVVLISKRLRRKEDR